MMFFSPKYQSDGIIRIKIKKYNNIFLTLRSMGQIDMFTKYTNDCVTDLFLLSAT